MSAEPRQPGKDGAGYRVAAMWLTDAELSDYLQDLAAITQPRRANAPGGGRRRRMFYDVLLPAPETQNGESARAAAPRRARKTQKADELSPPPGR
jgi:hypothetical protein